MSYRTRRVHPLSVPVIGGGSCNEYSIEIENSQNIIKIYYLMDIRVGYQHGQMKEPAYSIKSRCSCPRGFMFERNLLQKHSELTIMESKEIVKKGSSYKMQINANIGSSEKGG